jgi:hypothetical protein
MDLPSLVRAAIASVSGDPLARHRVRAEAYLNLLPAQPKQPGSTRTVGPGDHWVLAVKNEPWYPVYMNAPDADRVSLGIALLDGMNARDLDNFNAFAAPTVLGGLARRVPRHDQDDRHLVLTLTKRVVDRGRWHSVESVAYAASVLEHVASLGDSIQPHESEIRQLIDKLSTHGAVPASDLGRIRSRLLRLVGQTGMVSSLLDRGDTWGLDVLAYLKRQPDVATLEPLLLHLGEATTVSPTRRWTVGTHELLPIGDAEALIRHMVDASFDARLLEQRFIDSSPFQPANASLVRGAYWAAAAGRWDWVPETLGRAGLHWALSGRNDNYARDQRLANTTVGLLADLGTPEALVALGRIQAKVRNRNVAKSVAAALDRAALSAGVTASELLELAVPHMGLDEHGRREVRVGPGVATFVVEPGGEATLQWSVGGRVSAAVPTAMLAENKSGVASAKSELKELRKALSVERGRLENLLVEDRSWEFADWAERYRRHPLTAAVGAHLIWRFLIGGDWVAGLPDGDVVTRSDGAPLSIEPSTRVGVWHPIRATPGEIMAWRSFMLEHEIRQPFKQAFREVYLLTPAEEATELYSNRFAGHVLDYPVARALMGARRWGTNFLGPFDGGFEGIAKREFRSHGMRAEFYHDAIEIDGDDGAGPVLHCSTDQVRFVQLARGGDALPLRDVPPVVFSEAMRDVDLFVGVSSIAADVNWQDAGRDRNARFEDYWQRAAFGELTASAESRREVLAWMLPQLAIADRLTLEDRYLRVRGDRRSYRIHLGSANILMEPNDEYLCIVPGRGAGSAGSKVVLPFDDDHRLSVILSKAMLLANDRSITDPSIVRQIDR